MRKITVVLPGGNGSRLAKWAQSMDGSPPAEPPQPLGSPGSSFIRMNYPRLAGRRKTIRPMNTHAHPVAQAQYTQDTTRIDDTRIKAVRPLLTPALLQEWLPVPDAAS